MQRRILHQFQPPGAQESGGTPPLRGARCKTDSRSPPFPMIRWIGGGEMGQRERGVGGTVEAPGLVLLPRQGAPRLLGPLLLLHLGLEELPPFLESAADLLEL